MTVTGLRSDPRTGSRPGTQPAPPPARVAVPRAPFVALVLVLVVSGVLGILLLNTRINESAFVLHELREEQAVLDQREQQLEQQIAGAESSAQLAAAARRMGLVERRDDLQHLRLAPPDGEPTSQGG